MTSVDQDRYRSQLQNNYDAEMCSGSEEGAYLRRVDVCVSLSSRLESKKEEEKMTSVELTSIGLTSWADLVVGAAKLGQLRTVCHPRWQLRHVVPVLFQGSGCRVQGAGFRVQGAGFGGQGSGFRVQGSGFRVQAR